MPKRIHLSPGTTLGYLEVIGEAISRSKRLYWPVRCICGTEKEVRSDYLHSQKVTSCGCQALPQVTSGNETALPCITSGNRGDSNLSSPLSPEVIEAIERKVTLLTLEVRAMREQQAEMLQLLNHLSLPQVTQGNASPPLPLLPQVTQGNTSPEVTESTAVTDTLDWTEAAASNILPTWDQTFPEPPKPVKEPQLKNYSLHIDPLKQANRELQVGWQIFSDKLPIIKDGAYDTYVSKMKPILEAKYGVQL